MKVCLGGKMLLVVTTGLIAGALHVLAGPDHLAAIAPIAIKSRAKGASVGASWGWGHGLGVCETLVCDGTASYNDMVSKENGNIELDPILE